MEQTSSFWAHLEVWLLFPVLLGPIMGESNHEPNTLSSMGDRIPNVPTSTLRSSDGFRGLDMVCPCHSTVGDVPSFHNNFHPKKQLFHLRSHPLRMSSLRSLRQISRAGEKKAVCYMGTHHL